MRKHIFFSFFLLCSMLYCYSLPQINTICNKKHLEIINISTSDTVIKEYKSAAISENNVSRYTISSFVTTHFISPEPILYVDISTQNVEGDLPGKNILRLKPDSTAYAHGGTFQVTIVTQSFVAVYRLTCSEGKKFGDRDSYVITIDPTKALQTDQHNYIGQQEFEKLCMKALSYKRSIKNISSKQYGMELWTNNIFIVGDYLIFDIGARNKTRLQYAVDQLRFTLKDKYAVNAAVSQDIELQPVYQLYPIDGTLIKGRWRNLLVFKKFTFPNDKVFHIEINESQISGRKVEMNIDYNQVLKSQFLQ